LDLLKTNILWFLFKPSKLKSWKQTIQSLLDPKIRNTNIKDSSKSLERKGIKEHCFWYFPTFNTFNQHRTQWPTDYRNTQLWYNFPISFFHNCQICIGEERGNSWNFPELSGKCVCFVECTLINVVYGSCGFGPFWLF